MASFTPKNLQWKDGLNLLLLVCHPYASCANTVPETNVSLFFSCHFASLLWTWIFQSADDIPSPLLSPCSISETLSSNYDVAARLSMSIVFLYTAHSIWKARNYLIFSNIAASQTRTRHQLKELLSLRNFTWVFLAVMTSRRFAL